MDRGCLFEELCASSRHCMRMIWQSIDQKGPTVGKMARDGGQPAKGRTASKSKSTPATCTPAILQRNPWQDGEALLVTSKEGQSTRFPLPNRASRSAESRAAIFDSQHLPVWPFGPQKIRTVVVALHFLSPRISSGGTLPTFLEHSNSQPLSGKTGSCFLELAARGRSADSGSQSAARLPFSYPPSDH